MNQVALHSCRAPTLWIAQALVLRLVALAWAPAPPPHSTTWRHDAQTYIPSLHSLPPPSLAPPPHSTTPHTTPPHPTPLHPSQPRTTPHTTHHSPITRHRTLNTTHHPPAIVDIFLRSPSQLFSLTRREIRHDPPTTPTRPPTHHAHQPIHPPHEAARTQNLKKAKNLKKCISLRR